jgi:hypothetical protein
LILRVDLGGGRSGKIHVKRGDKSKDLASRFVREHELPAEILPHLESHIHKSVTEHAPPAHQSSSSDSSSNSGSESDGDGAGRPSGSQLASARGARLPDAPTRGPGPAQEDHERVFNAVAKPTDHGPDPATTGAERVPSTEHGRNTEADAVGLFLADGPGAHHKPATRPAGDQSRSHAPGGSSPSPAGLKFAGFSPPSTSAGPESPRQRSTRDATKARGALPFRPPLVFGTPKARARPPARPRPACAHGSARLCARPPARISRRARRARTAA